MMQEDESTQWIEWLIARINNEPLSFSLDELQSLLPKVANLQRQMTPASVLAAAARYAIIDMAYLIKSNGDDRWTPELEAETQVALRADGSSPSNRIAAHKRVMEGLIEKRGPSPAVDEWRTHK